MRDFIVLIILTICIIAAIRKPWQGVLSLAIFSYMNPHAFAWGFVRSLPVYMVLFLVVAVSTLITKDKQALPKDWRIPVFISLWAYFFITTQFAYFPEIAIQRFWFITKIYIPFFFTLMLINTREKLYYLIITIGASIGFLAVKGGLFAIAHGFSHRVYGPPGTQFYENNAFAVAVLISIPLLLVWRKQTPHKKIHLGLTLAVPVMYACSLSSWSRGALITMVVLTLILLRHSKHKSLAIPLVIGGTIFAIPYLPEEWFGRMHTLETYEEDESAMSRIKIWTDGWNHTLEHPFVGSGFEGWRWVGMRDWHSSYVEMFSEHGFIAFGLWLSLILGSVISLTRLPKLTKGIEGMEWVANYSFMVRLSIICYMTGTAFLGLSYWDLIYHLIFIAVLIKKFALEELAYREKHPDTNNSNDSSLATLKKQRTRSLSCIVNTVPSSKNNLP